MRKVVTQAELDFIRENWGKMKVVEIADAMGRCDDFVYRKAAAMGLGPSRLYTPRGSFVWTQEMEIVVINIRLPRIIMACLVGCSLSAAGAAYQGVFQNPMASPDILGASSGACFGAVVLQDKITFTEPTSLTWLLGFGSLMITGMAFLSSLITVALVFSYPSARPG